ncbi:PUA-like domain-containing protein [Xylaria acuta]|nr:PUA-like domain-containing protein [Xylaria acuta]
MLSPTIRHFGFDGSSSLPFGRRPPSPRDQSFDPLTPSDSTGPHWNQAELLDLSDSVRAGLRNGHIFSTDSEKLSSFLEAALKDEERRHPTLNFETIEYARLDKLLSEILQFADTMKTSDLSPEFLLRLRVNVSQAKNLRRLWRRRFREQFFMIDQHRRAVLVDGRLKDVSFNSSLDYNLGKWQTRRVTGPVSEVEANLHFEPGHWWLNITCAERDGIVNSSLEIPTTGCYGFPALPLLTGSEEMIRHNTVRYVREGRTSDMHVPLISQVGRKIRIFRGYKLKSIFAPEAGLRYDGLYIIRQYGCKLDSSINKYRLELTLERAADQRPFEDIFKVPKPSQLDDWALYEKLEGDKVRLVQGESSYLEWKLKRQEESVDREDWQRARLFRASFSVGAGAEVNG